MFFTSATLAAMLLPAVVLIAVAVLICGRIATLRRYEPRPLDWIVDVPVDRYRPMCRLLDEDDIRFLRAQPGATPMMLKRLRRQRCQVFQGYLNSLQRDFYQAAAALMLIVMQSQTDRRDLIPALVGNRLKFAAGVFRLRCLLVLYRWNMGPEPIVRLIDLFESLQFELRALNPSGAASSTKLG